MIPLRALALALALAAAPGAAPAETAAEGARRAAEGLRASIGALAEADRRGDRIAALTGTIRAYEEGLSALRDGLRRAAIREAQIAAEFEARRGELQALLGGMAAVARAPAPVALLHPGGPRAAAQAALVMGEVAPALSAEADGLRTALSEVATLRAVQESAVGLLSEGLQAAQAARADLSLAIQNRTDLPRRFLEDPEELRQLVENSETLDAFATGIARLETDIGAPMEDFAGAKGTLPLPVIGTLLRRPGEADAAGIRRPGLLVATRPAALVTAPWPATIRYRGPLPGYANVMMVEPAEGYLLVLAGLGAVYGDPGDVVPAGAALGLMGGAEPAPADFGAAFLAEAQDGGGAGRSETLYIEIREGSAPVDPTEWFRATRPN
jgi:septal ring factor EnvC (AmiA/AmiB activator)